MQDTARRRAKALLWRSWVEEDGARRSRSDCHGNHSGDLLRGQPGAAAQDGKGNLSSGGGNEMRDERIYQMHETNVRRVLLLLSQFEFLQTKIQAYEEMFDTPWLRLMAIFRPRIGITAR